MPALVVDHGEMAFKINLVLQKKAAIGAGAAKARSVRITALYRMSLRSARMASAKPETGGDMLVKVKLHARQGAHICLRQRFYP
jgi:hypothetical protein